MSDRKFRTDINGLRALAVVCVVLYHFGVRGFHGGYVGVDAFFVISGFLMTQLIVTRLDADTFSLLDFYSARARRIVPALAALNLVLLVGGFFFLVPSAYAHLGKSAGAAMTFVSNVVFWREQGYFDTPSQRKWLLHTWSLSVEWQFYLLFPLFLRALYRAWGRSGLLRGVVAALLASLLLSVVGTRSKPVAAFYLLPTRGWEMLAGALVCMAPNALRIRHGSIVGFSLIAVCTIFYDEHLPFPGYWAIVPVLGAALIIAARAENPIFENGFAQFLGDISYSFYLWHWPFVVGARQFEVALTPRNVTLLILAALIVAHASYRFIERPFKRVRTGSTPATSFARAVAVCCVVALAGTLVSWDHGIIRRVPPLVARNDELGTDWQYAAHCKGKEPCTLGQDSPRHVLFWGDSHVGHLYPALVSLVEAGQTHGNQVLLGVQEGCLPVRGLDNDLHERCDLFNDRMLVLAERQDIQTVVIASNWSYYFHADLYDRRSPRVCRADRGGCDRFESAEAALAFAGAGLTEEARALTKLGKRVYLVLPVPVYDRNVSLYLAKQAWSRSPVALQLSKARHAQLTADVAALVRKAARDSGAEVIDPADALCPGADCLFARDGVSLYVDNNHLTSDGSRLLAPELAAIIH